jgi:hypothetical protein
MNRPTIDGKRDGHVKLERKKGDAAGSEQLKMERLRPMQVPLVIASNTSAKPTLGTLSVGTQSK